VGHVQIVTVCLVVVVVVVVVNVNVNVVMKSDTSCEKHQWCSALFVPFIDLPLYSLPHSVLGEKNSLSV
jgi:hypothetical protein